MKADARVQSAIEVLEEVLAFRQPAHLVLKDWGKKNRYAGSKDRAAIATLVYDALRSRGFGAGLFGKESARTIMLGMMFGRGQKSVQTIKSIFSGEKHAPQNLSKAEETALLDADVKALPAHIQGHVPAWLFEKFEQTFGEQALPELVGLSQRAPLDVRLNTLKEITREEVFTKLPFKGEKCPHSTIGIKFWADDEGRGPALESEQLYREGVLEIQDEGSQLTALLSCVEPNQCVIDLCAGAGGKTLALAAQMQNSGKLIATDIDRRRLAPLYERVIRAGVQNVKVLAPVSKDDEPLENYKGAADVVFVDAPCSGSGTWRRNPDAKWRMSANALQTRLVEQQQVLERAAIFVKRMGTLCYVTCSMLREENDDQIAAFLSKNKDFEALSVDEILEKAHLDTLKGAVYEQKYGLQMTPARTGTDGFYLSLLAKKV